MRFCDFFVSYKITLKEQKNTIPLVKLPLYRKVCALIFFILLIAIALVFFLKNYILTGIFLILSIVSFIVFLVLDNKKTNLQTMLSEHYQPYSDKRMESIRNLLSEYSIDPTDTDKIDLLISEAEKAQIQCDTLLPLQKPMKALAGLIIPMFAFVAKKYAESTKDILSLLEISLDASLIIILLFAIVLALAQIAKDFLRGDYNKYDELIYDLRQIKLFSK